MDTSDMTIRNAPATHMDRRALMKLTGAGAATLAAASLFKTPNAEAQTMSNEWDKTFPKSEKVDHQKITFKNRYGITLAGDLYLPKDRANRRLSALAVGGPFGAVKEQSSGLYAQTMAERGFVTLAFDPSYTGESGGERLSEVELLQNCIFILNAGHETTTNLIGNGLELLLRFRDQRRRLIEDPGLIKTAIEEFLRYESSNQLGNRSAAADTEIGGVAIPKGTLISLCIGAANRDPEQFAEPDRFDIGRTPNRHLAFASGPHACVGLNLARLEGRIAIGRFLARFPAFASAGPAHRARRARFRGFTSLPVTLA